MRYPLHIMHTEFLQLDIVPGLRSMSYMSMADGYQLPIISNIIIASRNMYYLSLTSSNFR